MKKRLLAISVAALLLLSGCGASPAKTGVPKPTEVPAQTEVPVPTVAPKPTEAPTPAETPAPTPEPTEAPALPAPQELEGIYALYGLSDGSAAGAEAWLVLRASGSADYLGCDAQGDWREWRGMPYRIGTDGTLDFETPEDFIDAGMTALVDENGMLELHLPRTAPDGTLYRSRRIEAHEGDFDGRALTAEELAQINETFDGMEFCTTCYACPEEIDWTQVFYNGAGINEDPSETAWQEYLDAGGWGELDIEAIRDTRVREFVWKHTLTSYDLADTTLFLHWFDSSDGFYIFEHGDTNAIPVEFTEGYVDGELYKLIYRRGDYEHYVFDEVPYVLTAYIRDGVWQYVSNYPADWTAPKPLLTLRYFEDLAQAQALCDVVDVAETEQTPDMEPYDWGYAVFTALTDDVRWIVERAEGYEDVGYDVTIPGDYIASGVLQKGESAAVRTNQPWHAEMRLSASCGSHYASFIFGEDNWKHLLNDDARRLIGHDLAGEGRGCAPATEEELSAFLRDGRWALLDRDTGALAAVADFHDYRYMRVWDMENGFNAFLNFDRYDARPTQAPDVISLEYSWDFDEVLELPGREYGAALGDYQLWMTQLDGEQVLTLTQVSEEPGILSELFPRCDEGGVFTLHRYRGAAAFEGQG